MLCHAEYPHLIELQKKHGGPKFEVVSVVLQDENDPKALKAFLKGMSPNFPIVKPDQDAVTDYAIGPIPLNIVVGPDGTILERMEGAYEPGEWQQKVIPHIG